MIAQVCQGCFDLIFSQYNPLLMEQSDILCMLIYFQIHFKAINVNDNESKFASHIPYTLEVTVNKNNPVILKPQSSKWLLQIMPYLCRMLKLISKSKLQPNTKNHKTFETYF